MCPFPPFPIGCCSIWTVSIASPRLPKSAPDGRLLCISSFNNFDSRNLFVVALFSDGDSRKRHRQAAEFQTLTLSARPESAPAITTQTFLCLGSFGTVREPA